MRSITSNILEKRKIQREALQQFLEQKNREMEALNLDYEDQLIYLPQKESESLLGLPENPVTKPDSASKLTSPHNQDELELQIRSEQRAKEIIAELKKTQDKEKKKQDKQEKLKKKVKSFFDKGKNE